MTIFLDIHDIGIGAESESEPVPEPVPVPGTGAREAARAALESCGITIAIRSTGEHQQTPGELRLRVQFCAFLLRSGIGSQRGRIPQLGTRRFGAITQQWGGQSCPPGVAL